MLHRHANTDGIVYVPPHGEEEGTLLCKALDVNQQRGLQCSTAAPDGWLMGIVQTPIAFLLQDLLPPVAGSTASVKTSSGGHADRLRTDRLAAEKPQLQVPPLLGIIHWHIAMACPSCRTTRAVSASELPWRRV